MVRRLDDTKVGEYKNSWFFEVVQLLISIAGCVAVFLLPITYSVAVENTELEELIHYDGLAPIQYLFTNPEPCYAKTLSIIMVIFFGFLLLNIFVLLAVPKVSKTVYVKVSTIIEGILSLSCLVLLAYYLLHLFNIHAVDLSMAKTMYKMIILYGGIIGLALINSIFVYFTSKKVSIYD
jgi:hypothetical protein